MQKTLDYIAARIPQWELELLLRRAATAAVCNRSGRLLAERINNLFGRALQARCPKANVDWSEVGRIVAESVHVKNAAAA